jgi:hypothetical protein
MIIKGCDYIGCDCIGVWLYVKFIIVHGFIYELGYSILIINKKKNLSKAQHKYSKTWKYVIII